MTVRLECLVRTVLAIPLLWITASCGSDGGSSRSTPTAPTVPPPAASNAIGNYKTAPCCWGFWTSTLTRAGRADTWTCWGWIEIRGQAGTQLTGYMEMERDAAACPDDGGCANASGPSSGQVDSSGAITWTYDRSESYVTRVAEKYGCTAVSGNGTLSGTLVGNTLSLSTGWVLSCSGKSAQLTLSGRGSR